MLARHVHGPAQGVDDPLVSYAGSATGYGDALFLFAGQVWLPELGQIALSWEGSYRGRSFNREAVLYSASSADSDF